MWIRCSSAAVSEIGRAIEDPRVVDVCLASDRVGVRGVQGCVEEAVRAELANLPALRDAFLAERVEIF